MTARLEHPEPCPTTQTTAGYEPPNPLIQTQPVTMATVSDTDRDLFFPVFKFQRPEHSVATCRSGNIHLSKITRFRDDKHAGAIDDPAEGIVTLLEPIDVSGTHQFAYRSQVARINEAFIFCASSNVVSQSLLWA